LTLVILIDAGNNARNSSMLAPLGVAMRRRLNVLFVIGLICFTTTTLLPHPARAQGAPPGSPGEAGAAARIGHVVSATGSVTIQHAGAVVVQATVGQAGAVKVGDPVYLGDIAETGADGRLGVTFEDGTAFTLSNSARMVLNEFVYNPNGKSNRTFFSLTKGTFTFVAGKVAKTGDMQIDTPVATMGIRGTTPHVEISENGTVRFSTLIEEGKDAVGAVGDKRANAAGDRRKAALAPRGVTTGATGAITRQAQADDLSTVLKRLVKSHLRRRRFSDQRA
jgi:hypothetical protein